MLWSMMESIKIQKEKYRNMQSCYEYMFTFII